MSNNNNLLPALSVILESVLSGLKEKISLSSTIFPEDKLIVDDTAIISTRLETISKLYTISSSSTDIDYINPMNNNNYTHKYIQLRTNDEESIDSDLYLLKYYDNNTQLEFLDSVNISRAIHKILPENFENIIACGDNFKKEFKKMLNLNINTKSKITHIIGKKYFLRLTIFFR